MKNVELVNLVGALRVVKDGIIVKVSTENTSSLQTAESFDRELVKYASITPISENEIKEEILKRITSSNIESMTSLTHEQSKECYRLMEIN